MSVLVKKSIVFDYVPEILEKHFIRDVLETYYHFCNAVIDVTDLWSLTNEITPLYDMIIPSFYASDGKDLLYYDKLMNELSGEDCLTLSIELREAAYGEIENDIYVILKHFNFSFQVDSYYGFENGISPIREVW